MLKIFGLLKPNDITTVSNQERHATTLAGQGQRQSRAVKIVHAGGRVERYYMATPAAIIIQKNPSFVLARPEIFRRPRESVVRPEEILVPGEKYYVVSRRTVHKLMRRTTKPNTRSPSFSSIDNASEGSLSSFSGILVKPGIKIKARNLHVRFTGIDSIGKQDSSGATSNPKQDSSGATSNPYGKKIGNKCSNGSKLKFGRKERARIRFAWQPALQSITE